MEAFMVTLENQSVDDPQESQTCSIWYVFLTRVFRYIPSDKTQKQSKFYCIKVYTLHHFHLYSKMMISKVKDAPFRNWEGFPGFRLKPPTSAVLKRVGPQKTSDPKGQTLGTFGRTNPVEGMEPLSSRVPRGCRVRNRGWKQVQSWGNKKGTKKQLYRDLFLWTMK